MKNLTHRFKVHQQSTWFKLLLPTYLVLISLLLLTNDTFAQITQVGTATTANNSGTTITITNPAGIQVGDVLLANIVQDDNSGGTDLDVNVTSPGWTSIDGRHLGGTNPEWWGTVLYKVAVLADVSVVNYVFTLDADADGGIGSIVAFRNVNISSGVNESGGAGGPFDVDPGIINGIATDNSLSAASITTTSANAAVIMFGLMGDNDNDNVTGWTTTSPGALTELYENENTNGDDQTVAAAWAIKATAGATGAGSATLANSNINGSLLIALKGCTPPNVNPITGGASLVCIGATTPPFMNTTTGGVWSTSNNSIATINSMSGVATGVANGTVNVIYTVTDMSGCSASATASLSVGVPAQPSAISGPPSVAPNAMGVAYSVTNVSGVTYTWAFSPGGAGWTIATGQGSSSITINAGTIFPQILTVTPSNICGNGMPQSISISNADCTAPTFCTTCNSNCSEPVDDNPDLMGSCADLKIVLVLDESTSIGATYDQDVEAGFMAFVNTLSCTGVQLSVVEFNNQARFVLDTSPMWYHNVDNALVTAMQNYATGNGMNALLNGTQTYSPDVGTNYTNWQSAMQAVDHIPEAPDLVIFFTDGVPTKVYLTNPPPNFGTDGTICGDNNAPQLSEYLNPAKIANKLKCEGVHMFVAGVGGIIGNEFYVQALTGTTVYQNGINDITNSDYATGDFSQLALGLSTFVSELCPFDSEVTSQDICPGGTNGSITITLPGNLLPYNYEYYNDDTNVLLGSDNNIFTNPLVISGLMAGNYRIEVEVTLPGSGCTRTEIFFETISAGAVEVVASVTSTTQPSCLNPNDGTATVTITAGVAPFMITLKKGGVTEPGYPISTNATMYTAMGLDAGPYTFEIKDVNNCNTEVAGFTLNPPTNCCPEICTITGGPGGNVCPATESSFGATAEGCTTPTYSWTLINNTSNASIVGSTTNPTVTVNSGTTCGSYTIQSTLTCMGCAPLVCTQVVNVVDVTPPSFTFCPTGSNLGCNPSGVPGPGAATATDNCGTPTITNSLGGIIPNGCLRTQTRTYTATDACGNTATCTQVFTWTVDVTPPVFTFCPPGSDLGCNPGGGVPAPGAATATDDCGTPGITSSLGAVIPNGCLRTQTRTYTATDGCGNTATCTQVFTWTVDVTLPVFTFCPPGSDLGCNPGGGVPAPGAATATDDCGTPGITSSLGAVIPNGCLRTQTRTYTATDGCGNTATCTQVFTWTVDVTLPVFTFCPPGSDLGCNPGGGVPAPGAATATDDCGTPGITSSLGAVIPNGCLRTQTRTYTATDGCGNTATCTQVFTWTVDVTPPVFTFCPPGSELGCNPSGVPAPGAAVATDDCGTPGITSSLGAVIPNGCLRTQTRTYTATDGCGNTATCTQVFTWTVDVTPPVFTFCPPGSDLGCNPGGGVPAPGAATATDDCGTPGITSSLGAVIPNGCLRTQTRTYTATDGCGNTATCTQVFTWTVDVTPPVFTFCPPGSDLGCNPSTVPAPGAAVATDDCGTPGITSSLGAVIPNGCLRTQTRTYTATDGCGNTATCTQVFTWTVDVTLPVFTFCPPGSDLGCNPSSVPAPGVATATDDCGTPGITSSLGAVIPNGCLRTQTRTYTATDGCGNTATCTQIFTWTVDVTPPVFTFCPPGSDLGCNPGGGVPAPGAATATDDCGTPGITSSLGAVIPNGCLRTQTRTYTATDGCGNTATCTQVFTWTVDVTPPVFTFCPPGSDLGCNPIGIPAPGAAVATDDCGTPGITSSLGAVIPNGCLRTQTRTYTATDGCGNTATCTQVFTWTVDVTPPVFTFCPPGSNLGCNPSSVPAPGVATATDDCGTPGITSSLGAVIPDGCLRTQTRTYTATDGCGNTATCTQVFTWTVDVTPPVFTFCPPGSNLGCNPSSVPAPGVATATDDCGTPGITSSLGSVIPDGCLRTQTRTYTATDGCGNTATCTQVFTWTVDVTPPVFTFCPLGSDLGCNPSGVPAPGAAIATDDCGTPGITSSLGAVIPNGCLRTQTRTYTATDGCGNTATCTQVFTWTVDVTPPVFTFCPPGSNLGCNPSSVPAPGVATATDDCGTPGITSSLGSVIPDGCLRTQTRTYIATDGCGNTATCTQVFTWTVDVTPPVFTFCPPGSDLGCNPSGVPAPGAAIATDDCGTPGITSSLGSVIPDGCFRSQTRTYTATDGCGNTATCTQVFTWTVDVTPPVFTFCPLGSDLGCNPSSVPAPGAAVATDDCGTPGITSSLGAVIPNGCLRTQTRTYTATDGCGNTATCTQVFTWTVDVTPPVFTFCPPGSDLGCNPSGVPAPGAAIATDDCGTPGITSSLGAVIPNGCLRTQTRTYTATDGCGNTATCTQVFTWTVDVTPPVFTFCPPGSDLGCNPIGIPAPGAAIATDDCGTPGITSSLGAVIPNGCLRTQTRTYTATDGCGNTATCTQVFTWTVDVTPPVFTFCPPGSDLGCNPIGIPAPGAAIATDDCGTPGITSSLGAVIPNGCLRTQTRTYTATDGCGNTATCTQVFTWTVDVTPPVFTFCPPGSDLGCNPIGIPAPGAAIATDDCGTPGITSSLGAVIPDGCFRSQTRTYTATDGCGNTATCTQVFTWTVDVTPPVFTFCPPGSNLGCNPGGGVPAPGAATATDDCGSPGITSSLGSVIPDGCLRTQTRTYTATDGCGNTATCTQVFTWTVDVTPPVFTFCPVGSDLGCNPESVPAPGVATATDDCGTPGITSSLGSVIPDGCFRSQTRTYTATDGCGNTATCTQVFTWTVDVTPPVFTFCPPGSELGCNPNGLPAPGAAIATDDCGTPGITSSLGAVIPDGCLRTQTRTYTATDGCGNTATCTQVFTWTVDVTPPVFTFCPLGLDLGCNPETVPAPGVATATDDCGTPDITSSLGAVIPDGCSRSQTRTYVATDGCGNTATCIQVFTWTVDTAPPTCMTQNITVAVDPATGYVLITPSQIDNGSSDICGPVTLEIDIDSFTCVNEGTNLVILTVTDMCGNSSSCSAIVTVEQCYDPCVRLNTWVYLEGAATDPSGLANNYTIPMRTNLNDLQILPGQTLVDPFFGNKYSPAGQPYTIAPWNYPGTEGDAFDSGGNPMIGDAGYPPTVVDWVLVGLRADAAGTGGPVCQAAALLHNDGYIEFVAPFECCELNLADSFYIVIEHRNHLIVMSHMKLPIVPGADSSTITYDFRIQQSYEDDPFGFGVFAQKEINPGVFVMYAGNGDQTLSGQSDTDINFDDRSFWELENGDIGEYRIGDYNLNGDTNFNDRLTWERNNGSFTSVPRD